MSEWTIEGDETMRWDVIGAPPGLEPRWTVSCGVHGAQRVTEHTYLSLEEAKAKALRWSQSNSIGSYWSQVRDPNGILVSQFN